MQFKIVLLSFILSLIPSVSRAEQERPGMRQVRHLLASRLNFREGGGSINIGRQCTAHYTFSEADNSPLTVALFRNSNPTRIYSYNFSQYELRDVSETSFKFVTRIGEDCETQGCNHYYDFDTYLTDGWFQVAGWINGNYDVLACPLN